MSNINIPKIKTRLEVKNEIENVTEMYLYGSITDYSFEGEDTITSKNVRETLTTISTDNINVHINSGGGDVFESIAIYNLLKNHKAKVTVYVDSLAASGASIICMAADKIIMPKNSMMMIHKAWTYTMGNADELRKTANEMDKIDNAVTESYVSKFVGTKEELVALLAKEEWLNAEECKTLGFCDEILNVEEKKQEEPIKNSILEKYKNKVITPVVNEEIKVEEPKEEEPIIEEPKVEEPKQINNKDVLKAFFESFK
ncbi:head maturation protease, ClpP-related [Janthinobacterium sp.]|uniref:head maturation protease, ClpP-related n=1 Tax=Janthinobacterium sp. TaxID=1871054 RepID=UPI00262E862F|nr:head maturation protease, ClpP-related [Janthinobacterium sp.]